MADVENKIAVTSETVFDAAGLSRHFTGANVALLLINGAFGLEDNIRVFIPEMPKYKTPVTIGHLVYHTSGIADYVDVLQKAGMEGAEDDQEIIDLLAEEELEFVPGSRYAPNRSNYFLLAFVMQRVAAQSMGERADLVLFSPLEMKHSVFCDHSERTVEARAQGYRQGGGGFERVVNASGTIAGDVGLLTTIEDLCLWEKVLFEKTFSEARFYEYLETGGKLNSGEAINYAYGLDMGEYKGLKALGFDGEANGFAASLLRLGEKDLTVICLSNMESMDTGVLVREVADVCLAE